MRDEQLKCEIERVYKENKEVYGARKIYKQLLREEIQVARCTVERLMRAMGMRGTRRDSYTVTTTPDKNQTKPQDLVDRNFKANRPNQLWVADFTYVATWSGFVYVALIVDAYSRSIVGWNVAAKMTTDLVLSALECALWTRSPKKNLICHNDAGSQYLSIAYTERLATAGAKPSVGSVGDAYDNALAETIIGLFKAEIIRKRSYWKNFEEVEFATLDWVEWFNNKRLFEPIGDIPPIEYEEMYYSKQEELALAA